LTISHLEALLYIKLMSKRYKSLNKNEKKLGGLGVHKVTQNVLLRAATNILYGTIVYAGTCNFFSNILKFSCSKAFKKYSASD
jgi:hypothetical protein